MQHTGLVHTPSGHGLSEKLGTWLYPFSALQLNGVVAHVTPGSFNAFFVGLASSPIFFMYPQSVACPKPCSIHLDDSAIKPRQDADKVVLRVGACALYTAAAHSIGTRSSRALNGVERVLWNPSICALTLPISTKTIHIRAQHGW